MSEPMMAAPAPVEDRPISGVDVFLTILATALVFFVFTVGVGLYGFAHPEIAQNAAAMGANFWFIVGVTTVLDGVILLALLGIARRFTRHPLHFFFAKVPATTLIMAAATTLGFMALCIGLDTVLKTFFHIEMQGAQHEAAMMPQDWLQYGVVIVCLSVIVPVYEELQFRGFLLGWLSRVTPVWVAIAISAILFSGFHGLFALRGGVSGWVGTAELFVFGVLLAWWTNRARSLWPALVMHFVNNAVTFSLAFFLKGVV